MADQKIEATLPNLFEAVRGFIFLPLQWLVNILVDPPTESGWFQFPDGHWAFVGRILPDGSISYLLIPPPPEALAPQVSVPAPVPVYQPPPAPIEQPPVAPTPAAPIPLTADMIQVVSPRITSVEQGASWVDSVPIWIRGRGQQSYPVDVTISVYGKLVGETHKTVETYMSSYSLLDVPVQLDTTNHPPSSLNIEVRIESEGLPVLTKGIGQLTITKAVVPEPEAQTWPIYKPSPIPPAINDALRILQPYFPEIGIWGINYEFVEGTDWNGAASENTIYMSKPLWDAGSYNFRLSVLAHELTHAVQYARFPFGEFQKHYTFEVPWEDRLLEQEAVNRSNSIMVALGSSPYPQGPLGASYIGMEGLPWVGPGPGESPVLVAAPSEVTFNLFDPLGIFVIARPPRTPEEVIKYG